MLWLLQSLDGESSSGEECKLPNDDLTQMKHTADIEQYRAKLI
jgi:hypothetical protein